MTDITELQTELARLDPVTDEGGTIADLVIETVMVGWVESPGLDMIDPVEFSAHRIDDLVSVLKMLPAGCPTAEGEDGSLWEVLLEAQASIAGARRYIIEHHGEAGT